MQGIAQLLNVSEKEAEIWKSWGLHALTEWSGLEDYTAEQFENAEKNAGDDFFSMLNKAELQGRKLTFEEKQELRMLLLPVERTRLLMW